MKKRFVVCVIVLLVLSGPVVNLSADEGPTVAEANRAMRQAVNFFRTRVSHRGGYLFRYSADLTKQEGEHEATATTAWTQSPGTPAVGEAFLNAYRLTQDPYYLEAAVETAHALVAGQLQSGGWDSKFEFDPDMRQRYAYRTDLEKPQGRNYTTLDDDKTQGCLRFLMHTDDALEVKDAKIREAIDYALQRLIEAQYANGAWPQQFQGPADSKRHQAIKASYQSAWSRTYKKVDYRGHYTFNDNSMSDMVSTLLEAYELYQDPKCREAAERTGDFIRLAQMPEPQPGWAQQYDQNMHPAWARKFEPPAMTGGESSACMKTLMLLYRKTGETRFLEPIPKALAYYQKSKLPDGRLARFYELKTNRPLYFTRDYQLTYSSEDMPTHYAFIVSSRLDSLESEYKKLKAMSVPPKKESVKPRVYRLTTSLANRAAAAIQAMDERGAWVESGTMRTYGDGDTVEANAKVIETKTFIRNLALLSEYVAAAPK